MTPSKDITDEEGIAPSHPEAYPGGARYMEKIYWKPNEQNAGNMNDQEYTEITRYRDGERSLTTNRRRDVHRHA
jgi:hypothetical protein